MEEQDGPQLLSFLVLRSRQTLDLSVPIPGPLLGLVVHLWWSRLMHRARVCGINGHRDPLQSLWGSSYGVVLGRHLKRWLLQASAGF